MNKYDIKEYLRMFRSSFSQYIMVRFERKKRYHFRIILELLYLNYTLKLRYVNDTMVQNCIILKQNNDIMTSGLDNGLNREESLNSRKRNTGWRTKGEPKPDGNRATRIIRWEFQFAYCDHGNQMNPRYESIFSFVWRNEQRSISVREIV